MKSIKFRNINEQVVEVEVGKRLGELTDIVSDIIINEDSFVVVYGTLFKVYRTPFEYTEMHATKNPYQYTGRDKNI